MPTDRFLIAPLNAGQQSNIKPWLLPEGAYESLRNAYNWRSRVRKRWGAKLLTPDNNPLLSRLRIKIGTTAAVTGNFVGDTPLSAPFTPYVPGAIGQAFSIGNTIFTVTALGAPAAMLSTGAATGVYATAVGTVSITGNNENPLTDVYFYPALPVMGLTQQEIASINDEPVVGFDTVFAYQWNNGWFRSDTEATMTGESVWSGTNAQFFWAYNYRGALSSSTVMYVTNYNAADGLRYFDQTNTWNFFVPVINAGGATVETSRIIIPFQNRLLLLNTIESTGTYTNRCRFSQFGDPLDVANGWREDIAGRGGFVDAPTKESIITAQLFHDRLIVFFERSTYELVYTGNQILPFRWQIINVELGAESTFSEVPFDAGIIGIGNVGIHTCNGNSVARIDELIPDEVFKIHNASDGPERVAGIRDYYQEMVWWTFPTDLQLNVFPTRVVAYNYKNSTWAFFDDSITAFGYFQQSSDLLWQDANMFWQDADFVWNSATLQSKFPNIICGNQEGFTFLVEYDSGRNSPALQITNATNLLAGIEIICVNHNLQDGDYVLIENCYGSTELNNNIYQVQINRDTTDPQYQNEFILNEAPTISAYLGGGTITKVSKIDIITKQYNFYNKEGTNMSINKVDFLVDHDDNGEVTIEVYPSFSLSIGLNADGIVSGGITGNGTLSTNPYSTVPVEANSEQFWHPVYLWAQGESVQLRIIYSGDQMIDAGQGLTELKKALQMFTLNGMLFYVQRTSARFE